MIVHNIIDFFSEAFLFTYMLIINVIEVLPAALVGLIGEPHLNLTFFLLQSKSVYRNDRLDERYSIRYFWKSSCLLFSSYRLFAFTFGCHFERFLFFRHRRFVQGFDYIVFHH